MSFPTNIVIAQEYTISEAEKLIPVNSDSAVLLFNNLLDSELQNSINDEKLADIYFFLAEALFESEKYRESKENYVKSLEYYNDKALDREAVIKQKLGGVYYKLGDYDSALEKYQLSLKAFSVYEDTINEAGAFQSIGTVYKELDMLELAIISFQNALELYQSIGNEQGMADMLQNMGVCLALNKKYEEAEDYFQRALSIYKELGNLYSERLLYIHMGGLDIDKGEYSQAIRKLEKSNQYFSDTAKYHYERVILYLNFAKAYIGVRKYIQALENLFQAAGIAEKRSYKILLTDIYKNITVAYENQGDYKSAYQYYRIYADLNTEIYKINSADKIRELEKKYRLEVTERELAKKDAALERQKRLRIILIGILAILTILFVALIKLHKRRNDDRKRLEQYKIELERLVEKRTNELQTEITERHIAEESDKLKSAFLANMSHEIRTPMNAIVSFANFLKDMELSAEQREEYIAHINESSQTLLRLIDDIIDTAKIEANQVKINKESIHLNTLMLDLLNMFKKSRIYEEKEKVNLVLNPENYKSNYIIDTDKVRLKQILTNLIENGIKYTKEGYVEFGFTTELPGVVKFYIKDTGEGISKDKRHKVYDRFTRFTESNYKIYGGTGLGLSIAKELINLLGGNVWFESIENKGTTFYFVLPCDKIEKLQETSPIVKHDPQKLTNDYLWENKKILIAEDDDLNYKILETTLKQKHADVVRAVNGQFAVELSKTFLPDLILMDIQMPVMDGYEATRLIKELNHKIPIIAQTSFAMNNDKEKCLAAGCDDYLTKPIKMGELTSKINKFLGIL